MPEVLRLLEFVGVGAIGLLAVYRVLQGLLLPSGTQKLADPLGEAQRVWTRIVGVIGEGDRAAGYAPVVERVGELVKERLPRLVKNRERLLAYLGDKDPARLESECRDLEKQANAATDPALKAIHQRNLGLVKDRRETIRAISVLLERTNAQITNVLLSLANLEDRLVALRITEKEGALTGELEVLLKDVGELEDEYRKLAI